MRCDEQRIKAAAHRLKEAADTLIDGAAEEKMYDTYGNLSVVVWPSDFVALRKAAEELNDALGDYTPPESKHKPIERR